MRVGPTLIGDILSGEGDVFAAQLGVSEVVVHYRDVIPVSLIIALPLSLPRLASYFKALLHELEEAEVIDDASRVASCFASRRLFRFVALPS